METTKNTGLGSSLLLQRTERPVSETSANVPDVQTLVTPTPEPDAKPKPTSVEALPPHQTSKKSRTKALVLRDRCTLYLDRELNEQLHITSRVEGRERSDVVNDILRKHLPKYRIEREK